MANTQREEVIQYIRQHGSITRLQAASLYIFELSARIGELERAGYVFDREKIGGRNKYGRKWSGVKYSIDEEKTRAEILSRRIDKAFERTMAVMP